jgi:hypothetical protein
MLLVYTVMALHKKEYDDGAAEFFRGKDPKV